MLVNTHYAQTLVMEHEDTISIGMVPVTDRKKLLQFLQYLNEKKDYKHILLDISLDKYVRQEEDTTLYHLIDSMDKISIAMPKNRNLADTCLFRKAGEVFYYSTPWEDDFVKFPFLPNGVKSLPLKMYEELDCSFGHNSIFEKLFVRKNVFLTYEFVDTSYLYDLGDQMQTKDRYVLIGDFIDDVHNTYIGKLPGVLINFNAYLSLHNGHHRIKFWMLVILYLSFFLLAYQTLIQSKFTWLFMWIGYPVYLILLCFVTYYLYNDIYDILIATSLFYFLKTVVECCRERALIFQRINMILEIIKKTGLRFYHNLEMTLHHVVCIADKNIKLLTYKLYELWKNMKKSR